MNSSIGLVIKDIGPSSFFRKCNFFNIKQLNATQCVDRGTWSWKKVATNGDVHFKTPVPANRGLQ